MDDKQKQALRVTDSVPEEVWYWASLASIVTSLLLRLSGKGNAALFVGQWAPTFLLFGLYNKLLQPGQD